MHMKSLSKEDYSGSKTGAIYGPVSVPLIGLLPK